MLHPQIQYIVHSYHFIHARLCFPFTQKALDGIVPVSCGHCVMLHLLNSLALLFNIHPPSWVSIRMRLKKLEISGFKSFNEKVGIRFPAGICAIVGPNGCGKSNVVDALRWVMGEQSVKQLRGKKKEDIIFSGASKIPPLNLAEVSLTLVNDNGNMPEEFKDYSEIMVTRRLYRSGESRYLINRQPCRLKDISNIFMGSGAGAKTYSIIQQGNIGVFTDAGPDERRVFIEEAAGVTRYKARKNEALSKVKSTNRNLLRVADIVIEISRQMAGLKRQAQKAARYKKIKDRSSKVDQQLLVYFYDLHSRRMEDAITLLKRLKEKDLSHATSISRIDAVIEEIKLNRMNKNKELTGLKTDFFETQRKIDRIEADMSHLKIQATQLEEEGVGLSAAKDELEAKRDSIDSEIDKIRRQRRSLDTEIETIKEKSAKEHASSKTLRLHLADFTKILDTAKIDLMKLVAEEARYKNMFLNASNNRETLGRRLKRIGDELMAGEKAANASAKQELAERELHRQIKRDIQEVEHLIVSAKKRLDDASEQLAGQVKTAHSLEIDHNRNASRLSALKKMETNLDWYKDGVKSVLAASLAQPESGQEPKLNGVKGIMADLIIPDPRFETAVETALGESLQYLIVKDQSAGATAMSHLKDTGDGRCGFIPQSSIKPHDAINIDGFPEKDFLIQHIEVKEGFKPIISALLGHVAVVEDLETAMALFNQNRQRISIVTRDGEMISKNGTMTGGSPEKHKGILAKKQEIRQLSQLDKTLKKDLSAARIRQKEIEALVLTCEKDLQQLIARKNDLSLDLMEAEKKCYKASETLKNARRHLEFLKLEQEQITGEEEDLDDELEGFSKSLEKISMEAAEKQNLVNLTSGKIKHTSEKLETFNQKIMELKLNLTSARAGADNFDHTLVRLNDFQKDGIQRLDQILREMKQKKEKLLLSKKKVKALEVDISGAYETLKRLEQSLALREQDYTAIDDRMKENDSLMSSLRSKRDSNLQKIQSLELEVSENRIKRENIDNSCRERHHIAAAVLTRQLSTKGELPETPHEELEKELAGLRAKIVNIGEVNLAAIEEYEIQKERHDFLIKQKEDLEKAIHGLHKVIRKINKITQERFINTFNQINEKLKEVFPKLFEGGSAKLVLTEPDNPLETGVEFMAHPPGKKLTRMSLLSGGEKALSAISFIFSIFLLKPASFCLMDEIDAPLDDANVLKFNKLMKVIGEQSQIIMVTHNKFSMEFADTLFGITMEKKGLSRVVSVNLENRQDPDRLNVA